MIPLWLAGLIVLGAIVGIFLLILLICYGFIGIMIIKDKIKEKRK